MLKKFLLICSCCFALGSMAEDVYGSYSFVNIPLTCMKVLEDGSFTRFGGGGGGQHKVPPFLPVQISFDEENCTLAVEARQSCSFVLTVGDGDDAIWQEETISLSEDGQTTISLQALPAGTYTVAVQMGEVAYVGNLDI